MTAEERVAEEKRRREAELRKTLRERADKRKVYENVSGITAKKKEAAAQAKVDAERAEFYNAWKSHNDEFLKYGDIYNKTFYNADGTAKKGYIDTNSILEGGKAANLQTFKVTAAWNKLDDIYKKYESVLSPEERKNFADYADKTRQAIGQMQPSYESSYNYYDNFANPIKFSKLMEGYTVPEEELKVFEGMVSPSNSTYNPQDAYEWYKEITKADRDRQSIQAEIDKLKADKNWAMAQPVPESHTKQGDEYTNYAVKAFDDLIDDLEVKKNAINKEYFPEDYRVWFDDSAFDGNFFSDLAAIGATVYDAGQSAVGGILDIGEGIVDTALYGFEALAMLFAGPEARRDVENLIKKDLYSGKELLQGTFGDVSKYSLLGKKSEDLLGSLGQVAATFGFQGVGVPWWLTTGTTAFGSEVESAFNQGANYFGAGVSGITSAGAEILSEQLFGGIKFGKGSLDDLTITPLLNKISTKTLSALEKYNINPQTLAKWGVDAVGEGFEEVFSSVMSRLGQSLYREENLADLLWSEEALDEYIESFVGGFAMGGGSSAVRGAANTLSDISDTKAMGNLVLGVDGTDALIDKSKNFPELAQYVDKASKKASPYNVGKLYTEAVKTNPSLDLSNKVVAPERADRINEAFTKEIDSTNLPEEAKAHIAMEFRLPDNIDANSYEAEAYARDFARDAALAYEAGQKMQQEKRNLPDGWLEENTSVARSEQLDYFVKLGRESVLAEAVEGKKTTVNKPTPVAEAKAYRPDTPQRIAARNKFLARSPEEVKKATKEDTTLNEKQREAAAYGEKLGIAVGFDNLSQYYATQRNGVSLKKKGVVVIDKNATNPMEQVLIHEFSHVAETGKSYKKLKKTIMGSKLLDKWLTEQGFRGSMANKMSAYRVQKKKHYAEHGETLTTEGAEAEMIANFLGETIGTEAKMDKFLSELTSEQKRTFIEWLKDIWNKYFGKNKVPKELRHIEKLFGKALTEAGENAKTKSDTEVSFSIKYNAAKINHTLLELIKKVEYGNFKPNDKVYFGIISEENANRIYKLTGINVSGYKVAIEARQVEHILKEHGQNGKADSSLSDYNNIAKMEYALDEPDEMRSAGKTQAYTQMKNGKNKTADTVLYEKRVGESSYYVVQAVPDTKAKTLYIVTAFIGKPGYKKEALQLINEKNLDVTSKNGSANASINNISQTTENVKGEFSIPDTDKTYIDAVKRGDTDTAQKMVDEAARKAGYTIKSYHGTLAKDFTVFKKSFIGSRFSFDEKGFFFIDRKSIAEDYASSEFDSTNKGRVLEAYLKVKKPLLVDSQYALSEGLGKIFRDNDAIDVWDNYNTFLLEEAEAKKADGIIIDDGASKMTVVFDSEQIKSADPVTYDDKGNIIPLSKRFDSENEDVRFSIPEKSSDGQKLTDNQRRYFRNSKVRDEKGRLLAVYHGTKRAGFTTFTKTDDIGYFFARSMSTSRTYANKSKAIYAPDRYNSEAPSSDANYKVFLNITNPYVVDGKGAQWNDVTNAGDKVLMDFKIKDWDSNTYTGKGWAKLKYKGKVYRQYFTNPDQLDRFIRQHLNEKVANSIAYALNCKVEEDGKGNAQLTGSLPWDFLRSQEAKTKSTRDIVREASTGRYDGVVFKNVVDSGDGSKIKADDLYVAFYPNQIKSVNNLDPTYDNDITYDIPEESSLEPLAEESYGDSIPERTKKLKQDFFDEKIGYTELVEGEARLMEEARQSYGTIEEGENAVDKAKVPRSVEDNKNVGRYVRTILETGVVSDALARQMGEKVLLGELSTAVATDKKAFEEAESAIKSGVAKNKWGQTATSIYKIPSKNDIAIGERLLADAMKEGKTTEALEIASDLVDVYKRAGQIVQSASLLKKMTAAGRLVHLQRMTNRIDYNIHQKRKDHPQIAISESLAEELATAQTPEEVEQIAKEIEADVVAQIEVTKLDQWNAWRYLSMLGNPLTHARNVVGNAVFAPSVALKDVIATGLEKLIPVEQRTKALVVDEKYKQFASEDVKLDLVQDLLDGTDKMTGEAKAMRERRIFEWEWLQKTYQLNKDALSFEDAIFKNRYYKNALAGYLQARKLDIDNISEDTLKTAREYAVAEARKNTYNDLSKIAQVMRQLESKNAFANILVNSVVPFKQTPINIIKRGVEYSPIGLANSLTFGIYKLVKGKISAAQFIDGISAGASGTITFAMGMLLESLGWISCGFGDDEEDQFRKLAGEQEYSLQVFGKSYTLDWAAPLSIPFFVGAELMKSIRKENDSVTLQDISNTFWNSLDPVVNMSMLSGLENTIATFRYDEGFAAVGGFLENTFVSYFSQAVPTLGGKAASIIDDLRRSNYVDKNSQIPAFLQRFYNSVLAKLPGASMARNPYIDAWGREVSQGGIIERLAENLLSPGYYSDIEYTEVDMMLMDLYEKTGDTSIFPSSANKYVTVDGVRKELSADEYVAYAKAKGQNSYELIKEFFASDAAKTMTPAEKVKTIDKLYEYANDKAKAVVSSYDVAKNNKTAYKEEAAGRSVVDYFSGTVEAEKYAPKLFNQALESGNTQEVKRLRNDIVAYKQNEGYTKQEALTSLQTSVTTHWKPLYIEAYEANNTAEMTRIKKVLEASGLYTNVSVTLQEWYIDYRNEQRKRK